MEELQIAYENAFIIKNAEDVLELIRGCRKKARLYSSLLHSALYGISDINHTYLSLEDAHKIEMLTFQLKSRIRILKYKH